MLRSTDQCYILAFSLIMLHTDAFSESGLLNDAYFQADAS